MSCTAISDDVQHRLCSSIVDIAVSVTIGLPEFGFLWVLEAPIKSREKAQ